MNVQTVSMRTRDGVRLDADVYRPAASGDHPVLLMRQPYGRRIASTVTYAHPSWYAAQGYLVVIQDVRGRGTSEGTFEPFTHEKDDGFDSVEWAATLPGANGRVGMYGFSYQGMTQLYAAAAQPPALKAICPAMVGYDLYDDWAYEGGAFRLQSTLAWAVQVEAESARRAGDDTRFAALSRAGKALPFIDATPTLPSTIAPLLEQSFYRTWMARQHDRHFWAQLSPRAHLARTDLPTLHVGGWYDSFLTGTLACYLDMTSRCRAPQRLVVGPWGHLPWGRRVGDLDFGSESASPIDRMQLAWFDHFLADRAPLPKAQEPVTLFELGSNRWRSFERWPESTAVSFHLGSTGLACARTDDGRLSVATSAARSADVVVHDPWRPVPSIGGHAGFPFGPIDRASVDERADVLVYTTQPFESDHHFAGHVEAHLWCSSDAASFDLSVTLSEVHSDGRVFCLTQGIARVSGSGSINCHMVRLRAMCARIRKGHALRLSISAACFPAYDLNPGTGTPTRSARLLEQQVVTIAIASGGPNNSRVVLPSIDSGELLS
jgi:putative CocE/NonD family hydrolase